MRIEIDFTCSLDEFISFEFHYLHELCWESLPNYVSHIIFHSKAHPKNHKIVITGGEPDRSMDESTRLEAVKTMMFIEEIVKQYKATYGEHKSVDVLFHVRYTY